MAKTKERPKKAARPSTRPAEFWFDAADADGRVLFIETCLHFVEGQWAGQPFKLEPWQKEIVRELFGWKKRDKKCPLHGDPEHRDDEQECLCVRKYRTLYLEVPRKNAKTTLAAAIELAVFYLDREEAGQVYNLATDSDQARIAFTIAKSMVLADKSERLLRRSSIYRNSIYLKTRRTTFRVLSSEAASKHGYNPSCVVYDEFHAWKDRELYDVMITGQGARRQPLNIIITTAGHDRTTICWELHRHALQVLKGKVKDDTLLARIYAADESDDWKSPATWKKANPNLGVSVSLEFLDAQCKRAQALPYFENVFKRLHLNLWTSSDHCWLPMDAWDRSAGDVDPLELQGLPCYAGLDLSSTTDITALVLVFPYGDQYKVLPFFWIPEQNMQERIARDGVRYDVWVQQGLVRTTPGDFIDYAYILRLLNTLRGEYAILECAFDRWGAAKVQTDMQAMGLKIVPFGQGYASMNAPCKELERLVLSGNFHHGGHPVLRWMAENAIVVTDDAGNVKLSKARSNSRIDGIVAAVMALDRAARNEGGAAGSLYDNRGLRHV